VTVKVSVTRSVLTRTGASLRSSTNCGVGVGDGWTWACVTDANDIKANSRNNTYNCRGNNLGRENRFGNIFDSVRLLYRKRTTHLSQDRLMMMGKLVWLFPTVQKSDKSCFDATFGKFRRAIILRRCSIRYLDWFELGAARREFGT